MKTTKIHYRNEVTSRENLIYVCGYEILCLFYSPKNSGFNDAYFQRLQNVIVFER